MTALWGACWSAGLVRLTLPVRRRARALWLAPLLLWLPVLVAPELVYTPGRAFVGALAGVGVGRVAAALAGLALLMLVALALEARCVSLADVADESVIYAQVAALGVLTLFDPNLARRVRQRGALAHGRAWPPLPAATGLAALLGRGATGFVRQPSALSAAILAGSALAHSGAWLLVEGVRGWGWLSWLFAVLVAPPRALVHVFQADVEAPFLRQLLPARTLALLLADTAVPLLGIAACGAVLWPWYGGGLEAQAMGFALAVLLGLLFVLCLGAELAGVVIGVLRLRYEALIGVSGLLVIGGSAVTGSPYPGLLALAVSGALLLWPLGAVVKS